MAKQARQAKKAAEEVVMEEVPTQEVLAQDAVPSPKDIAIEGVRRKFVDFVAVGLTEEGRIDIIATQPTFEHIQYLLTRGQFEMNLYEKAVNDQNRKKTEETSG